MSQVRFPGRFIRSVVRFRCGIRDICEVDVALVRVTIPLKHGVNGLLELGAARLVDTARVDPEIMQAITLSLFATELNLSVTGFTSASALSHVFEGDFFGSPCMRENSVPRNIVTE